LSYCAANAGFSVCAKLSCHLMSGESVRVACRGNWSPEGVPTGFVKFLFNVPWPIAELWAFAPYCECGLIDGALGFDNLRRGGAPFAKYDRHAASFACKLADLYATRYFAMRDGKDVWLNFRSR